MTLAVAVSPDQSVCDVHACVAADLCSACHKVFTRSEADSKVASHRQKPITPAVTFVYKDDKQSLYKLQSCNHTIAQNN